MGLGKEDFIVSGNECRRLGYSWDSWSRLTWVYFIPADNGFIRCYINILLWLQHLCFSLNKIFSAHSFDIDSTIRLHSIYIAWVFWEWQMKLSVVSWRIFLFAGPELGPRALGLSDTLSYPCEREHITKFLYPEILTSCKWL